MLSDEQRETLRQDQDRIERAKVAVRDYLIAHPRRYGLTELAELVAEQHQTPERIVLSAIYLLQSDGTLHTRIGGVVSLSATEMDRLNLGGGLGD